MADTKCSFCNGTGRVRLVHYDGSGGVPPGEVVDCTDCAGTGRREVSYGV